GHRADRPVCRIVGCRAQRALDHCRDLIVVDRPRPARSGLVQQTLDTIAQEAPPPLADGMLVHAQLRRDDLAWDAISAPKNDPAPLRHGPRYPPSPNLPFQIIPLFGAQYQRCRWSPCRIRHRCAPSDRRAAYNDAYFSSRRLERVLINQPLDYHLRNIPILPGIPPG